MSAIAADFTGNWSGEGLTNGETHPLYFMLKQDGNALTGSGGPNESEQHPLQNGKIERNKIVFDVPLAKGNLHFELTLEGDGLKGAVQLKSDERDESGTVSLKRVT